MSQMIDNPIYNFYDYAKSIYIYSHIKTNLIDSDREVIEKWTNIFLGSLSIFFALSTAIKIFIILFYFLIFQVFLPL